MSLSRRGGVWGAGIILPAAQLPAGPTARAENAADALLRAYAARLPALRTALSEIAAAAEAAAERRTRQPEVAIPFAPGRMGPISGIHAALIYRMIDAAAAERSAPRAEK